MKKVYIASRFTPNKAIVKEMSHQLADAGIVCTQTWPDEHSSCLPMQAAIRDIHEIDLADTLLLYTVGCESVPGGMHFEAGYAYAKGKNFALIGPKVNVFCHLAVEFGSIEDFIGACK